MTAPYWFPLGLFRTLYTLRHDNRGVSDNVGLVVMIFMVTTTYSLGTE